MCHAGHALHCLNSMVGVKNKTQRADVCVCCAGVYHYQNAVKVVNAPTCWRGDSARF